MTTFASSDSQVVDRPTEVGRSVDFRIVPPARIWTGPGRVDKLMRTPLGALLPVFAVIALWELGSRLGIIDRTFFPAPSRIATAASRLATDQKTLYDLVVTAERVVLGFLIGTIPAILLGLLMGRQRWVGRIFDPLISVSYPIPHIATLPLLLVIFGLGSPPIIALAAIVCFYPVVVNTLSGVRQVNEHLVLMARNMGATERQVLWKIVLPGAVPSIFAGVRLGLGMALLGTIAGEFVAASEGIGAQTWLYWQIYQIDNMYATLLFIVAAGFLLTNAMLFVERRYFGWSMATQHHT